MLLPILLLTVILQLIRIIVGEELSVIRHADGDIFTVEGSCNGACAELSSGTGSPYSRGTAATSTTGISITNGTCVCQCNGALPVFREDLHICVSDIHECSVAGFVGNFGDVERVPYVFLPQRGQIIYPQAEIRFEGVTTPVCGIAGSQQLGKSGWLELRNLSNAEPPFRLFRDEGRTFLQWIGEDGLRDAAEGKVVVAKLVCRDASPNSDNPGVFIPCVAFRVAGSPSKSNIREVTFASTGQTSKGLSAIEYTAIGISSILLALIYVASVSLYLHSRKARKKLTSEEPEVAITSGRDGAGLIKSNPLLVGSRHFDSDTNSGPSDDELADDNAQSDGEQGFENPTYCSQQVTSAIIHPHCVYIEHPEGPFGNGTILGERIPDEDVRIVETIENAYQHETPVLPGTQRRKLYFNPAYFERQLLLAPPPAAIEFLMKIREVISIAKHKMTAKRFVPILTGIPEEENTSDRCSSTTNNKQPSNSIRGSVARSRKSQRCTGCPGCAEKSSKNLPHLPETGRPMIGDSRVRAWLEDVKPPERRWNDANDGRRNFQENSRTFARSFEYLREMAKIDFLPSESSNLTGKSLATWKENPPMLRTFRNIARSEILEDEDRHSVSKRSTKSMFEESNYDRYYRSKKSHVLSSSSSPQQRDILVDRENTINAKVRKAIENSFIKQMEENATIDNNVKKSNNIGINDDESDKHFDNRKRSKKMRAPDVPSDKIFVTMEKTEINQIPPKRMMDAVIRELVDAKVLENCPRTLKTTEYEIDSLERTCRRAENREISEIAENTTSTMKNMSDELENNEISQKMIENEAIIENLPKIMSQRCEEYSLVSEVYVNDGYASPAGSDDSGPEIRYERENPGHLTIKVQDSPENYVKQDDSEYEPDTLDRKPPMRLIINGDVSYEGEKICEIYVDSLERQGHISLKSRGSFRDDDNDETKNIAGTLQRGYGSLREIYEARLRTNLRDSSLATSTRSLNGDSENTLSWRRNKYLTPDTRQAKRQRKPQQNQPDVVPLPPSEEIYQRPKPPRRVEYIEPDDDPKVPNAQTSKNALDRSKSEAVDPAASDGSPVLEKSPRKHYGAGNYSTNDQPNKLSLIASPLDSELFVISRQKDSKINDSVTRLSTDSSAIWRTSSEPEWKIEYEKRARRHLATLPRTNDAILSKKHRNHVTNDDETLCKNFTNERNDIFQGLKVGSLIPRIKGGGGSSSRTAILGKIEDSGYLSSTDSNESRKHLLRHENNGSVSETDETESMCDGASESGAESVGTDSVFFGNFRRLSEVSNFSKSVDSGVDIGARNTFFKGFGDTRATRSSSGSNRERTSVRASDSESESFVTVLSPDGESRRNSLVL